MSSRCRTFLLERGCLQDYDNGKVIKRYSEENKLRFQSIHFSGWVGCVLVWLCEHLFACLVNPNLNTISLRIRHSGIDAVCPPSHSMLRHAINCEYRYLVLLSKKEFISSDFISSSPSHPQSIRPRWRGFLSSLLNCQFVGRWWGGWTTSKNTRIQMLLTPLTQKAGLLI